MSSVADAIGPELENWPLGRNWLLPFIQRLRLVPADKARSFSSGRGYSSLSSSGSKIPSYLSGEQDGGEPTIRVPVWEKLAENPDAYEIFLPDDSGEVRRYVRSSGDVATKPKDYDDSVIIRLPDGGFLWRQINGDWRKYDGKSGDLLFIGDRKGNYLKLEYDTYPGPSNPKYFLGTQVTDISALPKRLVKIADGRDPGKYIQFVYAGNSKLISKAVDSLGREVSYSHEDNRNNLTRVTDVRGNAVSYTYDDLNRMTSKTSLLGSEDYPEGKTVYLEYMGSGSGRISAVYYKDTENEFGHGFGSEIFGKYYDYQGSADNSVIGTVTSSEGRSYEKTYDFQGNVFKIKGPYGVLETYEYEMNNKGVPRKISRKSREVGVRSRLGT